MEKKKFSTLIQEFVYLKQWLSHNFLQDSEYQDKKKRFEVLAKNNYGEKELAPFNKELGRSRAGTLQHLIREIFSVPQRILIDREIYRRMEGKKSDTFKYLLVPFSSDEVIYAACIARDKSDLKDGTEPYVNALKSEILNIARANSPHLLVKEILAGATDGTVSIEHILSVCHKMHPEFPISTKELVAEGAAT